MSEHYCQYTADNHDKTYRQVKQCGQPANIKIAGRWFYERHTQALATSGDLDTLYGFPSGWTDVEY